MKILAKEKNFGNPLCVCGCGGNCQIIYNCTYMYMYLFPSKFLNGMIKSELNNDV